MREGGWRMAEGRSLPPSHKSLFENILGCHDAEITTLVHSDCSRCFDRCCHCYFHGCWIGSSTNHADEESCWRQSLHANQRGRERHHPLPLVRERRACRGGTCRDRRRRFWGTEPHLPHQPAEPLRG